MADWLYHAIPLTIAFVLVYLLPNWRAWAAVAVVDGILMLGIVLIFFGIVTPVIYALTILFVVPLTIGAFGGLVTRALTLNMMGVSRQKWWIFGAIGLVATHLLAFVL